MTMGRFAGTANPAAAEHVHDLITKMAPEEARVFGRMLALEGLDYDHAVYGYELAQAQLELVEKMERTLVERSIAKAAEGAEPGPRADETWQALQLIRKDLSWTMSSEERARLARSRHRDFKTKRFMRESRQVQYDPRVDIDATRADALGIPDPTEAATAAGVMAPTLDDTQLQHFRQGYAQVQHLLEPYRSDPRALLEVRYLDGSTAVHPLPTGDDQILPLNPGKRVVTAEVHVVPRPLGEQVQRGWDAVTSKPVTDRHTQMGGFANDWARKPEDQYAVAGTTLMRRTQAASNLLNDTLGGVLPPQAQVAVKAGQYIGAMGPDAMRVVNPVADRAAYRYRGTEIAGGVDPVLANHLRSAAGRVPPAALGPHPDEELSATLMANRARLEREVHEVKVRRAGQRKPVPKWVDPEGRDMTAEDKAAAVTRNRERSAAMEHNKMLDKGPLSGGEARTKLKAAKARHDDLRGRAKAQHQRRLADYKKLQQDDSDRVARTRRSIAVHGLSRQHGVDQTGPWNQAEVLEYFRQKLPAANRANLQLKSGHTAPSQGVILTADGKVAHQSVGYGDDWYVPFNLKQLDSLRGGEYIRTRTFGGLTPEDLYTGLAAGARSVTVVSHSGTFTVEFDDSLKGGRRYNDKTARMVSRYASLLDSVKSGQIAMESTDPDLEREIEDGAALAGTDAASRRAAADRSRKALLDSPRISNTKAALESTAFLQDLADTMGVRDVPALTQQAANTLAARDVAAATAANESRARDRVAFPDMANLEILQPVPVPNPQQAAAAHLAELDPDGTADMAEVARRARLVAAALDQEPALDKHLQQVKTEVAQSMQPLRLNGRGYYTATSALKDQFPFAIKQEYWHPWPTGTAEGRDTGYIRPNHNRPAEALVGYFDPSPHAPAGGGGVAQGGKVRADSIRGQEREPKANEERPKTATAESKTGKNGTPEASRTAKTAAAKQMLHHLHTVKFQAGTIRGADGRTINVPAGYRPADSVASPNFPPALAPVYSVPEADFARRLDDPAQFEAAFKELTAAVQFGEDSENTAMKLDPALVATLNRGGMASGTDDYRDIIASPDQDRYFPGRAFERDASTKDIERAYPHVTEIQPLAGKVLPASPMWGPAEKDQADKHLEKLRADLAEYDSLATFDTTRAAALEVKLKAEAKGHAAARQLARRHERLLAAENQQALDNAPDVLALPNDLAQAVRREAEENRNRRGLT